MTRRFIRPVGALALIVALWGCEEAEQLQDRFRDMTPHEAYQQSLVDAGLGQTALGRDWLAAGRAAVADPATVPLPFEEEGFITPEDPGAMAYRVSIARGQKLTAEVSLIGEDSTRVFVDLFRVPSSADDPLRPIYSSVAVPDNFEHEPWRGGDFIVRVQPELLRGGQYRIKLSLEAQLVFPVEGHGIRSAQSLFGVDRDGGRRTHDGIDIFARRGTPVLAASAGRVNRVDVTNLGGKVVWVRDPVRNANVYYAHLDSQYVSNGDMVQAGDTVGFVGNTGNARTTPPHLHFGLYRRGEGPVDPLPFVRTPSGTLPEMTADLDQLGAWVRLTNDGIRLREGPGRRSTVIRELDEHTAVHVMGGSGEYFRVVLPDGNAGYVAARLTEPVEGPVDARVARGPESVRTRPAEDALVMTTVAAGSELPVLGRFADYLLVETPSGATGWMTRPVATEQQ